MAGEAGDAYIEVGADTSRADREFRQFLKRLEAEGAAMAEKAGREYGEKFSTAMEKELQKAKATIQVEVDEDVVRRSADRAAREASRASKSNPVKLQTELEELNRRDRDRFLEQVNRMFERVEARVTLTPDEARTKDAIEDRLFDITEKLNAPLPVTPEESKRWNAEITRMIREVETGRAELGVDLAPLDSAHIKRLKRELDKNLRDIEAKIPLEPEYDGFRDKVNDIADEIRKSIRQGVPVEPVKASQWRKSLDSMMKEIEAERPQFNVEVSANNQAFLRRFETQFKKDLAKVEAIIPLTPDGEKFRKSLDSLMAEARAMMDTDIPVGIEEAAGWRAKLQKYLQQIEEHEAQIKWHLNEEQFGEQIRAMTRAVTDAGIKVSLEPEVPPTRIQKFRAELAQRLGTTTHHIDIDADVSQLEKFQEALSSLSGMRVLDHFTESFVDMIRELDTLTPMVSGLATAMGVLAAAGIGAGGALASFATDLGHISRLGLMMPAMFGAMAAQNFILGTAFDKATQRIKPFGDAINGLKANIDSAFWDTAIAGFEGIGSTIMELANDYMPRLSEQYANLAVSGGQVVASSSGIERLSNYFGNLISALSDARVGFADLIDGLLTLASAGSEYFPKMASWFNEATSSFSAWADKIVESGQFFDWVDDAAANFGALIDVIGGVLGIIGALGKAAEAAGGPSLRDLADLLQNVSDAMNSVTGQARLFTMFEAGYVSLERLVPGIAAVVRAFEDLGLILAWGMVSSAEVANMALEGLADALGHPAFAHGLSELFRGIHEGMTALAPELVILGEKFGLIIDVIGQFASTLGEVMAVGLREFGPVISHILLAVEALIPVLGDMLISVLKAIAPIVVTVVSAIADWITNNPQLVATIIAVVGALSGFVVQTLLLVGTLTKFWGVLTKILFPALRFFAKGLIGPIIGAIGSLVAAVGIVPIAIGVLAAAVVALVVAVVKNWDEIVAWTQTAWGNVTEFIGQAWENIKTAVGAGIDALVSFFTDFGPKAGALWSEFWTGLGPWFATAWETTKTAISEGFTAVVQFFTDLGPRASELWSSFWSGLGQWFLTAWETVKVAVSDGFTALVQFFTDFGTNATETWSGFWSGLGEWFLSTWEAVKAAVSEGFNAVVQFFVDFATRAAEQWSLFWTGLSENIATFFEPISTQFSTFLTGLVDAVVTFGLGVMEAWSGVWVSLQETITAGLEVVRGLWENGWLLFNEALNVAWTLIQSTIGVALVVIGEVIRSGMEIIEAVWNGDWTRIGEIIGLAVASIQEAIGAWIENMKAALVGFGEQFVTTWNDMWARITEFGRSFIETIVQFFVDFGARVSTLWFEMWSTISQVVSQFLGEAVTFIFTKLDELSAWWSETLTTLRTNWDQFWADVWAKAQEMISNAAESIRTGLENIRTGWDSAVQNIRTAWSEFWTTVRQMASDAISNTKEAISNGLDSIRQWWDQTVQTIKTTWTNFWDDAKRIAQEAVDNVLNTVRDWGSRITDLADTVTAEWNRFWSDGWREMLQNALDALSKIKENIQTKLREAWDKIVRFKDDAVNTLVQLKDDFARMGREIVQGLINGVKEKVGSAVQAIKDFGSNLVKAGQDALGIKSPSRKFRDAVGKHIPTGVAAGIDRNAGAALSSVTSMADSLVDAASSRALAMSGMGAAMAGSYFNGMDAQNVKAKSAGEALMDAFAAGMDRNAGLLAYSAVAAAKASVRGMSSEMGKAKITASPSWADVHPSATFSRATSSGPLQGALVPAQAPAQQNAGETIMVENFNITVSLEHLAQLKDLEQVVNMALVMKRKKGIG